VVAVPRVGHLRDRLPPGKSLTAQFSGRSRDERAFHVLTNERDRRFFDAYRYEVDGDRRSLLYEEKSGFMVGEVSGDGRWVALPKMKTTADPDVHVWDARGGTMTHVTPHKAPSQYEPAEFDPDSTWLYYLTNDDGEFTRVRRYEVATGRHEDVESSDWDFQFTRFSRDGRYRVAAVNEDGRTVVRVHDTRSGGLVPMPRLPEGDVTSVVFWRDESRMLISLSGDRSPTNLYACEVGASRRPGDQQPGQLGLRPDVLHRRRPEARPRAAAGLRRGEEVPRGPAVRRF
jgi:Tol biopolymer transport system component